MKEKLIILLILFSINGYSQRKYDQIIEVENTIQELVQNEITGILVTKSGSTIQGIDPETQKVVWTLTKENIGSTSISDAINDSALGAFFKDKKELNSVPNSPYVEVFINSKYLLINTETGKIIYNTYNQSFYVFQSDFIPEVDEYLLTLKKDNDISIALLDTKTGGLKWTTNVSKSNGSSFSFKESTNSNIAKVNGNVVYYLLSGKLYSFDRLSGKLNWVSEEDYTKFFTTQNNKNVVVVNSKGLVSSKEYLNVLSAETGKSIWKESIKTKGIVYLEDWGSQLLIAHYGGFNFFDLKTGEKVWKKDARGDGLKKVLPIDQDFLYVAEDEMMLINKNGEKLWKDFIKIADDKEDPIYYLGKVKDKVMYLTSTYGNMVDYKSGKKLWKRNIKFNAKRPVLPTYDENTNSYLVYNDEELYKFDPNIDDKPEPFAKVNIKQEKELSSIEMFPWGVVLAGPTEIMGVDMKGAVKYHRVYTQPGEGTRQLIKGAAMIGSVALNVNSTKNKLEGSEITMTYRNENGGTSSTVIRQQNDAKMSKAEASDIGAAVISKVASKFTRLNSMKQVGEYTYIYAKDDSGQSVLVKIRKEDGSEVDKLIFQNDRPIYEIDVATQNIFYVYKNTIQVFYNKN